MTQNRHTWTVGNSRSAESQLWQTIILLQDKNLRSNVLMKIFYPSCWRRRFISCNVSTWCQTLNHLITAEPCWSSRVICPFRLPNVRIPELSDLLGPVVTTSAYPPSVLLKYTLTPKKMKRFFCEYSRWICVKSTLYKHIRWQTRAHLKAMVLLYQHCAKFSLTKIKGYTIYDPSPWYGLYVTVSRKKSFGRSAIFVVL